MALEEFKHFFQEATDTNGIDVSLLSSPTTINLFKKYRRYELPFFYYNADTRREFGEIPSNILDSYFALCKKLTQKEDISFDEYSKYLNLFYTVTDIPKGSTIKEVSSIYENIGPDKKRDSLVKFGVGTKKPYNKSVRLFHTSDNPNIKNLKPFFRSQSPRDRHVEALFPRPRVYFGYNVPVTRLGGSLDRQTEEQKKKFFDEKVVYEYVGPSEYITAVYTDPELSGGVAVYVETTRELPVKRITYDEYVNGIKDKNIQESYGPEEDHTTGTSEFDEPYDDDPDDCYCESFDLDRISPDIQLRPADEYYLDNIIEWKIQTILEGYPDKHPSPEEYNKISNYVKNETPKMLDDTRIIMYDNDQPIGMIIAYQKDQDWFIDDIFLIPEFRHEGIGRMILENEIASHDQLALWVYKSNAHAISLYESLGFKVEESIKERQMMRLRKTDVEMTKGWRVTYQGIGIYEALKNAMFTQTGSPDAWISFINSGACNWLPKPPSYGNDNKSFFTEDGFNRFNELVLPIIAQYIDQTKIYIEEIMVPTNQIVYSDEFQFVTSDTIQESTIPRSNEVYTNGGSIEKINNLQFDKVYFGSPNKLSTTMKLDGPLFVSPYPGIASIFSVRPQNLSKYGVQRGQRVNRDYDEWNRSLIDTVLQKPLRELHVRLQGDGLNIKPTTELVSGYLYTIDVTPEIKDHIYQSSKMSKVFEFCIDKIDSITFSDIKKINVRMTVTGGNRPVQEAYDAITGKEIPIDHAYTMDEMKERTYTDDDIDRIQSKEELDAFYAELKSKLGQDETIQEAKLPSKKRNKLPDSDFALVYTDANGKKIRKYPIHDEAHCKAAAHMFPRGVPLKYKATVARKILRRAHKFGIDTSGWKNLNNFNKRSDK